MKFDKLLKAQVKRSKKKYKTTIHEILNALFRGINENLNGTIMNNLS